MGENDKITYNPNQVIFREGDQADNMYVLVEGAVEIRKKGEKGETLLRTVSSPNEFFGEMALIDGKPRSATAVASLPTTLLVVDRSTFEKIVTANGAFAMKVIKVLSDRIRKTNVQLQELVDTDQRTRISLGILDFAMRFGKKTAGDGRVIALAEMRSWVNSHLGASREEIDAIVYRMLKSEELVDYGQPRGERTSVMLSSSFIRMNDRRHLFEIR
jgi:CRP/FNR family cyclic AMP-dependent transcriptional regulator